MARVFMALQHLLPRYMLTALVYRIARIRVRVVKDALIRGFVRLYKVELGEIDREVPRDFRSFNDFFTRELAPGARPVDSRSDSIVSPVDGTVSIASRLHADSLVQAKGIDYTLDELFAADLEEARAYRNGCFATIYLAPYNYHRVHMPQDGLLLAAQYIPGDLFSVNAASVALLPGLFRRNERLVMHFETSLGRMALIFVGALNVGSITTPWTGEIRPRRRGVLEPRDLGHADRHLRKGDLLGWFNMGSTVIVLLEEGHARWDPQLVPGTVVRMGGSIGSLTGGPD